MLKNRLQQKNNAIFCPKSSRDTVRHTKSRKQLWLDIAAASISALLPLLGLGYNLVLAFPSVVEPN